MKVRSPKVRGTATAKSFTLTVMYSKANSKRESVTGLVCVSLLLLDQYTRVNGEKTNLWGTVCSSLCQMSLLKVDLTATG